jgi:hypothetical protein
MTVQNERGTARLPKEEAMTEEARGVAPELAALLEQFRQPQFMTTQHTGGLDGKHAVHFAFSGPGARDRCDALADAIRDAAKYAQALSQPQGDK